MFRISSFNYFKAPNYGLQGELNYIVYPFYFQS